MAGRPAPSRRPRRQRTRDRASSDRQQPFEEIARDERNHVKFLLDNLGGSAVAEPAIDSTDASRRWAARSGVPNFNPFADQLSFLPGACIFEEVGVTACNGAAPLVTSKTYLGAAASILAVVFDGGTTSGGFFPDGVQGTFTSSVA